MATHAKERKRKAVSDLRDLAEELGLVVNRRDADLSDAAFRAAHAEVVAACRTDAHKQRATVVAASFRGEGAPRLPALAERGGQQAQGLVPALAAQPGARARASATRLGNTRDYNATRSPFEQGP